MDSNFDDAVIAFRKAQEAFVQGDPGPVLACYSRLDEVTLANPLGPPHLGPVAVAQAAAAAAAQLRDGVIRGYQEISRVVTEDLGYVVEIERTEARIAGSETMNPIVLRATLIFRREDDGWRLLHRHADTITAPRPVSSIVAT